MLTQSAALADYFEAIATAAGNAKAASNWIMGELLRTLNERGQDDRARCRSQPAALAGLIALDRQGHDQQLDRQGRVREDVRLGPIGRRRSSRRKGWRRIGDEGALSAIVADVIGSATPTPSAQYRAGKQQTFGFLVGQVMKASGGKANPKLASTSCSSASLSPE